MTRVRVWNPNSVSILSRSAQIFTFKDSDGAYFAALALVSHVLSLTRSFAYRSIAD